MEPSESSPPQLPPGAGEEKEELKEADDVKLDVPEDTAEILDVETSTAAQRHLTEGKRKEQMMEADEVKLDVAKDSAVETLDAESSMAAHRRLTEARSLAERANDNCFIHKVHSGLRGDESAKHYEPVLLSIGPYHHGKPPLQDMEKHKIYYSPELLGRKEQQNNATYIEALKNEKGDIQAIDCYVDTFQMDVNSFEKCMVLDGFFMIELFRRYGKYVNNDMLLNRKWMKPHLSRDMLLFENQIPLFVLRHLFALKDHSHSTEDFVKLALAFFEFNGRPIPFDHSLTSKLDIIPHLLGLVYNALVSRSTQETNHEGKSFEFIRSAAALQDVGVKFIKAKYDAAKDDAAKVDAAKDDPPFYDVGFSEGVLSIPHLVIDDSTESFFRNLVAYEQYSKNNSLHQVADYLQAMDCLINSAKDVELLRHRGIIDNRIGDDEQVSAMFNTLCSGVYFDQNTFFYGKMFDEVNKFCRKRRNVWMAKLKHEYFGSPWTLISFLAALLLLLLTATQTVFSVISCYRH